MSEETKTPAPAELPEQELENVAGGKTYNETRSNTTAYSAPPPPPNKAGSNPR